MKFVYFWFVFERKLKFFEKPSEKWNVLYDFDCWNIGRIIFHYSLVCMRLLRFVTFSKCSWPQLFLNTYSQPCCQFNNIACYYVNHSVWFDMKKRSNQRFLFPMSLTLFYFRCFFYSIFSHCLSHVAPFTSIACNAIQEIRYITRILRVSFVDQWLLSFVMHIRCLIDSELNRKS